MNYLVSQYYTVNVSKNNNYRRFYWRYSLNYRALQVGNTAALRKKRANSKKV